eukprot:GAHX01002596.1.p1 GENE.GAHX01002596.1~~GAHX01002596.1.p1  ORF type:complete len:458 (-),score=93.94 GAHX01002596.1:100-1431(-)
METTLDLKDHEELYIHNKPGELYHITLLKGEVDIFGAPLPLSSQLSIPSDNLSLYANSASKLKLVLPSEATFYTSSDTEQMNFYRSFMLFYPTPPIMFGLLNIKSTLVLGSRFSGKNSLCQTYINYYLRKGIKPIFIDLDLQRNILTLPGCIAGSKINSIVHNFELFDTSDVICYFIGTVFKGNCISAYKKSINALAEKYISGYMDILHSKSKDSDETENYKNLYFVINLNLGNLKEIDILLCVLKAFKVKFIEVLNQEKMWSDLKQYFNEHKEHEKELGKIKIQKLNRSKGIVDVEDEYIKNYKNNLIKKYFHGSEIKGYKYYPHKRVIDFKNLNIFKRSKKMNIPSTAMPLNNVNIVENEFYKINIVKYAGLLKSSVLAISSGEDMAEFDSKPIFGFLLVTDVNVEKKKIICLSICLNELPADKLIVGEIRLKGDVKENDE